MEFLANLGDWFNAFTSGIERIITSMFGSSNERRIKDIGFDRDKDGNVDIVPASTIDQINSFEAEYEKLTDDELRQTAPKLREKLKQGATLDDILPESFAATREAGRRFLQMRHYDVQMVGGYILHHGMIAEMVTGEGKTLVATLPAALNALSGHVHAITVNDYLAQRDMEWMGIIYQGLGLTVGAIQANMDPAERQKAYASDITYGTNNEFGFDYLRDNMKPRKDVQVQGPLDFALIDEIDNILIDEARTPLIISGPAEDDLTKYPRADSIARQLKVGEDFEVKEKEHSCHLTEDGIRRAEEIAGVESFYTAGNMEWPHLIDNSLKAHHLYKLDVTYVVEKGEVVIVDEFTGRKMEGRQWSDGLHQAVQAKEGLKIKAESQTLATITLQNFFKLYKKLGGMTGTAMTEAGEFWKIYGLDVVAVPTNRVMKRINHPDKIYRTEKEKWDAVVKEIREVHETGRPVLVGTTSIEKSELIGNKLTKFGIKHNVLNAKHHEREAEIISQAGRTAAVTIATNMAGRGTDIILGGNPEFLALQELTETYASRLEIPKQVWDDKTDHIAESMGMKAEGRVVEENGGLHVVGTERHDSRRIDLQLRGRSGRQGDSGSSRFFLAMDDPLLRMFGGEMMQAMMTRLGLEDGEPIESRMLTRRIEGAQKKREEYHFDIRKNLLEYDEVMDEQRKQVYSFRQRILDGADCRIMIEEMIDNLIKERIPEFLSESYHRETIVAWAEHRLGLHITANAVRDLTREQLDLFIREEAKAHAEEVINDQIDTHLPEDVEDEREWSWQALSKWANQSFDLNTNDKELKKIGRADMQMYLYEKAQEAVERLDLSDLDTFLRDDFGRGSLCGFLEQQLSIEMTPEHFEDITDEQEAVDLIRAEVTRIYEAKETEFPVSVGMHRFMSDGGGGDRYDREGLIRWTNNRFGAELDPAEHSSISRNDMETLLTKQSEDFFAKGTTIESLDERLDRVFVTETTRLSEDQRTEFVTWANSEFGSELTAEDLRGLDRDYTRIRLNDAYQAKYRPELRQAERSLILEVIDTAWKEHLYYMDHLRSGIGLVGYAQKDPKVEYKREGRKAFQTVWNRVDSQVSAAIFRMDRQSPDFVGSLWRITNVEHEDPQKASQKEYQEESGRREPGAPNDAVDPIKNMGPKVGRNDLCPCGSGKKYKKCHGAGVA
ncbi:MAG: preprotein translocase subunit SecA [Planctomycetaceae bacterium]|jgi:preprotein translocase subunit SecA|nr:preprotein translocase subunit SecA [Planctomycetaceae bacterium]